jgi:hypothetical protein
VTAREIAEAVGVHRTSVIRSLDEMQLAFVWKKGPSGQEKHYPITLLPEEYRVAVMAKRATAECTGTDCIVGQIGADAAKAILAARAEEKERELIAKEQGLEAFERLPEQRRNEAKARLGLLQLCEGFIKAAGFAIPRHAQRSKKADRAFVEAYNEGRINVPEEIIAVVGEQTSYSTLRRFADHYEKHGMPGLASGYHNPKKGCTTLTEEMQQVVIGAMCKNPNTSSANIRRTLQGRFGHAAPTEGTISRFRARWIEENRELWLYYTNPDEWKNKCLLAFGSASEQVERLNQLWEADSTPADVMLVDGRHSIIGMIDVYSRRLRFLVSKTSKATAIVGLLRHCIIEWGVPETLKIDNGQDYKSAHVTRVLDGLEIDRMYCTPFQGQEKPHIERSFRTFLHGMVELMPNYIGHNVPERKAIEARRSFAERVMNKANDPVEVNMTAEQLQKFCNEWVEFSYMFDAHSGLDGKKPIDMVRNWKQPIRRIHDLRALDMLLMPAPSDGGRRTIGKKGVQVDGRFYQSQEFAGKLGESVFVLLDPVDMGTAFIYLYSDRGERSFLCVAIDPQWHGIDRAKFSTASRHHQDKIMREGVKKLKQFSKEEANREAYADYVDFRKAEVGNLVEFPAKAEEHSTPMLEEAAKAVSAADRTKERHDEMAQKLREVEIVLSDPAPVKPAKKEKIVNLITCKSDRYFEISASLRKTKRRLTRWEYDFLTDFYTTDSTGKGYLLLEGDLRQKYGVEDADQAEL